MNPLHIWFSPGITPRRVRRILKRAGFKHTTNFQVYGKRDDVVIRWFGRAPSEAHWAIEVMATQGWDYDSVGGSTVDEDEFLWIGWV